MAITEDTSISQVVRDYPQTIKVFIQHGMSCFGCAAASFENIGQGARMHGIDIKRLIADLNKEVLDK